jgi:hypothetical protein
MRTIQHGLLLAQLGWAQKFMKRCTSMQLESMDSTVNCAQFLCFFAISAEVDELTNSVVSTQGDPCLLM